MKTQSSFPRLIFFFSLSLLFSVSHARASVTLDLQMDQDASVKPGIFSKTTPIEHPDFFTFEPYQYSLWPDTGKLRTVYRTAYAFYEPYLYTVIQHDQDGQRIGYQHYQLPSRKLMKEAEFIKLQTGVMRISKTVTYDEQERPFLRERFTYDEEGRIEMNEKILIKEGVPEKRILTHYDRYGRKVSEKEYQILTEFEVSTKASARTAFPDHKKQRISFPQDSSGQLTKEVHYQYSEKSGDRLQNLIVTGYNGQYQHARTVHVYGQDGRKKGYKQIDLQDGSIKHDIVFAQ